MPVVYLYLNYRIFLLIVLLFLSINHIIKQNLKSVLNISKIQNKILLKSKIKLVFNVEKRIGIKNQNCCGKKTKN